MITKFVTGRAPTSILKYQAYHCSRPGSAWKNAPFISPTCCTLYSNEKVRTSLENRPKGKVGISFQYRWTSARRPFHGFLCLRMWRWSQNRHHRHSISFRLCKITAVDKLKLKRLAMELLGNEVSQDIDMICTSQKGYTSLSVISNHTYRASIAIGVLSKAMVTVANLFASMLAESSFAIPSGLVNGTYSWGPFPHQENEQFPARTRILNELYQYLYSFETHGRLGKWTPVVWL